MKCFISIQFPDTEELLPEEFMQAFKKLGKNARVTKPNLPTWG